MIDSTSTDHTVQETVTSSDGSNSLDIHRHDSQTDMKKYVINYVDETSIQSDFKSLSMDKNLSSPKETSSRLEVSQLPEEVVFFSVY